MELITRFLAEEEAADATEYALMIGLIALAIVVAVTGLGTQLSTAFSNISASVKAGVP